MDEKNIFRFKYFNVMHGQGALKITTDSILLGAWCSYPDALRVLDIGTGCGILALMMAQRSGALIDAIDISREAVALAGINFRNSPWNSRLSVFHSDVKNFSPAGKYLYDLIVSNPPYFSSSLRPVDPLLSVSKHDVLLSPDLLFRSASRLLNPKGRISLIFPSSGFPELQYAAALSGFMCIEVCDVITTEGASPSRKLVTFSKIFSVPLYQQIIIQDRAGKYSSEFKHLTGEYNPDLRF